MTELLPDALNEWPLAARGRPCYLATAPDAVFAMLHAPEETTRSDTGVILCSPFGWDELSAHRSLRCWAGALAEAGHPARLDIMSVRSASVRP